MEIGKYYYKKLHQNPNIQILPPSNAFSKNIYWVVGIVIKKNIMTASMFSEKIARYGVGTRPFFWPMHKQDIFIKMGLFKGESYPIAENLAKNGFYLPSGVGLKNNQLKYIIKITNEILG